MATIKEATALKDFKVGQAYFFFVLTRAATEEALDLESNNEIEIGASFKFFRSDKSEIVSFVATGYNDNYGLIFTCVYSDFSGFF